MCCYTIVHAARVQECDTASVWAAVRSTSQTSDQCCRRSGEYQLRKAGEKRPSARVAHARLQSRFSTPLAQQLYEPVLAGTQLCPWASEVAADDDCSLASTHHVKNSDLQKSPTFSQKCGMWSELATRNLFTACIHGHTKLGRAGGGGRILNTVQSNAMRARASQVSAGVAWSPMR